MTRLEWLKRELKREEEAEKQGKVEESQLEELKFPVVQSPGVPSVKPSRDVRPGPRLKNGLKLPSRVSRLPRSQLSSSNLESDAASEALSALPDQPLLSTAAAETSLLVPPSISSILPPPIPSAPPPPRSVPGRHTAAPPPPRQPAETGLVPLSSPTRSDMRTVRTTVEPDFVEIQVASKREAVVSRLRQQSHRLRPTFTTPSEDFVRNLDRLPSRFGEPNPRSVSNWMRQLSNIVSASRTSGVEYGSPAFLSLVTPQVAQLASRRFTDPTIVKQFLGLAAHVLPWESPNFETDGAVRSHYGDDIGRQVSEVLEGVIHTLPFRPLGPLYPREDLMCALSLERGFSYNRPAIDRLSFSHAPLTVNAFNRLQFRAWSDMQTSQDLLDFDHRWMSPDKTLGVPKQAYSLLHHAMSVQIDAWASDEHFTDYLRAVARILSVAAKVINTKPNRTASSKLRNNLMTFVLQCQDRLRSTSNLGVDVHLLLLDIYSKHVPVILSLTSSNDTNRTAEIVLFNPHKTLIESLGALHPQPDFVHSLTPLLNSLIESRLLDEVDNMDRLLDDILESGKVDPRYLVETRFLHSWVLAFPKSAVGSLDVTARHLWCKNAGAMPDSKLLFHWLRTVEDLRLGGARWQAAEIKARARSIRTFCSAIIAHIGPQIKEGRRTGLTHLDGQREPYQEHAHRVVEEVLKYIDSTKEFDSETRVELLSSVMNVFNFCAYHDRAFQMWYRIRDLTYVSDFQRSLAIVRVPSSLCLPRASHGQETGHPDHSLPPSQLLDLCGQSGINSIRAFGQQVWEGLAKENYPFNANNWSAYREFLARFDDIDRWIDTFRVLPSTRFGDSSDPQFSKDVVVRHDIVKARQLMSRHGRDTISEFLTKHTTHTWLRERYADAIRHGW